MMHDFRQSSEALRLSQVSKMLLQLSGQISAHCSSSEIRNTHLRLFRPDQGPHTVHTEIKITCVCQLQSLTIIFDTI